jgi:hypothetical protein
LITALDSRVDLEPDVERVADPARPAAAQQLDEAET